MNPLLHLVLDTVQSKIEAEKFFQFLADEVEVLLTQ